MKKHKKLYYINWGLIILIVMHSISGVNRAFMLNNAPIPRLIVKIVLLIIIIKYLIKYDKWGYILCMILAYSAVLFRIITLPLAFRTISTAGMVAVFTIDIIFTIAYVVLGHIGLNLSKKHKG